MTFEVIFFLAKQRFGFLSIARPLLLWLPFVTRPAVPHPWLSYLRIRFLTLQLPFPCSFPLLHFSGSPKWASFQFAYRIFFFILLPSKFVSSWAFLSSIENLIVCHFSYLFLLMGIIFTCKFSIKSFKNYQIAEQKN